MSENLEPLDAKHQPAKRVTLSNAIKKKLFVEALKKSLGVVTPACETIGIARKTFYDWMNRDPKFAEKVHSLKELSKDFVESKIFELINGIKIIQTVKDGEGNKKEVVYRRAPDTTMCIFYAKTQMKDRGYIEKQYIEQKTEDTTYVDVSQLTDEELRVLAQLQHKCRAGTEKPT